MKSSVSKLILLSTSCCCLCGIGGIWWKNLLSDLEVGHKVPGPRVQLLEQALNMNKLRWLGHILPMFTEPLPRCTVFSEARNGWKMGLGE